MQSLVTLSQEILYNMSSTTFVDQSTPIVAAWLNDVNTATYITVPGLETAITGAVQKANNLSDLANVSTARTNLGLTIGTDVQAFDAATAKTNQGQQWTAAPYTQPLTDNDLSFDISAKLDFVCTPTAGGTLTFTNIRAGAKGDILFINNSNYTIAKAATVKASSSFLTTISATGRYIISYRSLDGTNVDVVASAALS